MFDKAAAVGPPMLARDYSMPQGYKVPRRSNRLIEGPQRNSEPAGLLPGLLRTRHSVHSVPPPVLLWNKGGKM